MLVSLLQYANAESYIIFVVLSIVKLVTDVPITSTKTTYGFVPFPRYFPLLYSVYVRLMQL